MQPIPVPSTPKDIYLDQARKGKNDWWRYVLSILLIFSLWQIIGSFPTVALLMYVFVFGHAQTLTQASTFPGVDPLVKFISLMLASVFFLLGIFLSVRYIHQRSLKSLITPARSLQWGRIGLGAGLWFLLAALSSVLEALLHPGRYVWTFDLLKFVPFAVAALILIPIQASTEELFFRGYLLQWVGLKLRNIWLLSVISGLIFAMPHLLNPEAAVNLPLMFLGYFSMGLFLAYMTLRDGQLELALGVHTANNLFSVLFANTTITSLPSPSILTVQVLDPVFSVPVGIVAMLIFVWLVFYLFSRKTDISR